MDGAAGRAMTEIPHARVDVSKVGLLVALALLAFGLYTAVAYFRSGGQGHGMTVLRALVAVPLGCIGIYLSFSTVCSACGATLARRDIRTSQPRAADVMRAAATGDGPAVARACTAASGEPGLARVAAEVCPRCRRLARLREPDTSGGDQPRTLTGEGARPIADAVLAVPEPD